MSWKPAFSAVPPTMRFLLDAAFIVRAGLVCILDVMLMFPVTRCAADKEGE